MGIHKNYFDSVTASSYDTYDIIMDTYLRKKTPQKKQHEMIDRFHFHLFDIPIRNK